MLKLIPNLVDSMILCPKLGAAVFGGGAVWLRSLLPPCGQSWVLQPGLPAGAVALPLSPLLFAGGGGAILPGAVRSLLLHVQAQGARSRRPGRQGCGLPETSLVRSPQCAPLINLKRLGGSCPGILRPAPVLVSPFALVSAGAELILLLGSGAVLCFGFRLRMTLVTHRWF